MDIQVDRYDRYMLITQDTKNGTRNLELGSGMESGNGGDCVIRVEELEERVSSKRGRTHCGRPHEALSLLRKVAENRTQVQARPLNIPCAHLISQKFQILEAPAMSTAPGALIVVF